MTKLKVYYDGWLALPAALRRQLDLRTDAVLEAELVDGTIVLRPTTMAKAMAETTPEPEARELSASAAPPAPGVPAVTPAKRKPGRPRKVPAGEQLQLMPGGMPDDASLPAAHKPEPRLETHIGEPLAPAAAPTRPRGRPHKVAATPKSEPASFASESAGSELRRKVVLPTTIHEHGPVRGRRPTRSTSGAGYEREERRPFGQVEVRKLGPGRGHNRSRGSQSQL